MVRGQNQMGGWGGNSKRGGELKYIRFLTLKELGGNELQATAI